MAETKQGPRDQARRGTGRRTRHAGHRGGRARPPGDLPLVALRETVIFPEMIVPLQVGRDKSVAALNAAVADGSARSRW